MFDGNILHSEPDMKKLLHVFQNISSYLCFFCRCQFINRLHMVHVYKALHVELSCFVRFYAYQSTLPLESAVFTMKPLGIHTPLKQVMYFTTPVASHIALLVFFDTISLMTLCANTILRERLPFM